MKKIGFSNFRRFIDFPPIEYNGITFLIGRNNAGKSTVVKAILLAHEYFKSSSVATFSFVNALLEDVNIVTYGRAKNKNAVDDAITFYYEIEHYSAKIVISGDEDKTYANVHSFVISDLNQNLKFEFNPTTGSVKISKDAIRKSEPIEEVNKQVEAMKTDLLRIKSALAKKEVNKASKAYIEVIDEMQTIERRLVSLTTKTDYDHKSTYSVSDNLDGSFNFVEGIDSLLTSSLLLHDQEFKMIQDGRQPSTMFQNYRGVKEDANIIKDSITLFQNLVSNTNLTYLGANLAKQSALFAIRDRGNALAQAIHDFYQLRITPGETEHSFMIKWMKVFEIGETFEIAIRAGEAYEVSISADENVIQLADKGMGSIQAMLLLFRLACIIRKRKSWIAQSRSAVAQPNYNLVIIEEPELSMHPALQSRLTDLFLEVHITYGIHFIIETHSEYMVRRSQVVVAEKDFAVPPNENPFYVHYFQKDSAQEAYQMSYEEDGVFNRSFGSGFFDEAAGNTLDLLRIKRAKQS
jgi:predicted ATPase